MDAPRTRRRSLFRQQAVNAFIGVHGTGATPDLLRPPLGRGLRLAAIAIIVAWIVWLGAAVMLAADLLPHPIPVEEASSHG